MSNSDFTPTHVSRLSSLTIRDQIAAYEQIAQTHFDKAAGYKPYGWAAAGVVRHNELGRQNQEKANDLRMVLAVRRKEHQRRQRFVAKCLEVQPLAHAVLEGRAA